MAAGAWLLAWPAAGAPLVQPSALRRQQLGAAITAQPELGAELHYGLRVPLGLRSTRRPPLAAPGALVPRASLGTPFATIRDGQSWDAALGLDHVTTFGAGLGVVSGAQLWLSSADTPKAELVSLGLDLHAGAGWLRPRWALGLVARYRPALATHVRHGAAAQAAFGDDRYPEGTPESQQVTGPADGWYRTAAHTLGVGLESSFAWGRRVSLEAAIAFQTAVGGGVLLFPDVGQLPLAGRVGVSIAF